MSMRDTFLADMPEMKRAVSNLKWLLERVKYKSNWRFEVGPGPALLVKLRTTNSLPPHQETEIVHRIMLPPFLTHGEADVEEWLLRQIINVETHEACEFFNVGGKLPYFPDHHNPYVVQRAAEPHRPA